MDLVVTVLAKEPRHVLAISSVLPMCESSQPNIAELQLLFGDTEVTKARCQDGAKWCQAAAAAADAFFIALRSSELRKLRASSGLAQVPWGHRPPLPSAPEWTERAL